MTNNPITDKQLMKVGYAYADLYRELQLQLQDFGIELVIEQDGTYSVIVDKHRKKFQKAGACISFILNILADGNYGTG